MPGPDEGSLPLIIKLSSGSLLPWSVPMSLTVATWKDSLLRHCGLYPAQATSFGLALGHVALEEDKTASFNDLRPGDTLSLFRREA